MADRVTDTPVINRPNDEPSRHYAFDDQGTTNEIVDGRRRSEYFVPVPQVKKKASQLEFEYTWTRDRLKQNDTVNLIRDEVALWRKQGYPETSPTSLRLLTYCRLEPRSTPTLTQLAGLKPETRPSPVAAAVVRVAVLPGGVPWSRYGQAGTRRAGG